ncbi:maleylpyruvate isomerase N-terminal domain-containing protein [Actinomadura bangladeshensis]|uniref:MDMPI C-terminal domain-containing protein n=1 Tax=Actinomadura bangladeshensis TaxID=453573 RepID=A0A4R4PE11_9ACTN|nr:maleylpyruvate isomerase N-terminal domain-containing protein [Actinomadura bangladeshensis]TDC19720.1 hypothetical protein E1284_02585 [Actinomadura bangladeshensis]
MISLAEITAATQALLATAARLDDADVRGPSLLPDWTRGHVLTHVDLDASFAPGDWPADFTSRMLAGVTASFARRDDGPALRLHATDTGEYHGTGDHLVTGPAPSLLAWLLGRSPATGLSGATHLAIPFLY